MDEEKVKEFLKELTELTNRYEIRIGGCGCCGSPYLVESFDPLVYSCDSQYSLEHKKQS